ncbi:MAG: DUF2839 domain-containing protein [Synechococcales cyanobacterium]
MGDSKRRQASLGEQYRDPGLEPILPGLPITKKQASDFYRVSTQGAWLGIGVLIVFWVTVRFLGPMMGWWHVQ